MAWGVNGYHARSRERERESSSRVIDYNAPPKQLQIWQSLAGVWARFGVEQMGKMRVRVKFVNTYNHKMK